MHIYIYIYNRSLTQIEIASLRMDFEGVEFVAALNNGEGKPFSRLTFAMAYTRALGLETLPTTGNPVSIVLLATYASYVLLGLYPLRKVSAVRWAAAAGARTMVDPRLGG